MSVLRARAQLRPAEFGWVAGWLGGWLLAAQLARRRLAAGWWVAGWLAGWLGGWLALRLSELQMASETLAPVVAQRAS